MDIHVGQRLRELRMARRMSLAQIGAKMGTSPQQIYKYESGKSSLTPSSISSICKIFGVIPDHLFAGLAPEGMGVAGTGVAAANRLAAGPCRGRIAEQIRVMVVGGDGALAAALGDWMERSDMVVTCARTGAEAIGAALLFRPDVALVDLKLPDVHGATLIEHLKGGGDIGIIAVSDRNNEAEKAAIIEAGADDYVTKPPPLRELVARVRAVHRRARPAEWTAAAAPAGAAEAPLSALSVGPLTLDLSKRTLTNAAGERVPLTTAEFNLLVQLLSADGAAVPRHLLSERVLRRPLGAEDRSVDQIVHRLRRKLFTASQDAVTILTEHRYGYRIGIKTG